MNPVMQRGIFEIIDVGNEPFAHTEEYDRGVLFLSVKSGKLKVVGRGYEKTLGYGECIVLAMGRGYKLYSDGDCKAPYAVADGSLVYDLMRLYGITDFMSVKAPEAIEALVDIHERFISESGLRELGDVATSLHRMILKLNLATMFSTESEDIAVEIKKYIDSHLEGKITLDNMSKIFFVSKTQIFRSFRDTYGIAPMQYCLRKKIEVSKEMLSSGVMKISEVSDKLAFTDAKHFTKTFKRFTGELPKDYKRRNAPKYVGNKDNAN